MATVLIVEDESILAMKTEIDLIGMGHQVIGIVKNGREALNVAKTGRPDIILMDIVLQGDMDGIDTSKRICEIYDCKIIYMTAHADEKTIEIAKHSKHVGFLHKPFEPYQLQRGIDKALQ